MTALPDTPGALRPTPTNALRTARPFARKRLHLSVFAASCLLVFLISSVLLRFLMPVGDEPDYYVRLRGLAEPNYHPSWSPYRFMQDRLQTLASAGLERCNLVSSPFALWASIDPETCTDPLARIIDRLIVLLTVTGPLLLLSLVRFGTATSARPPRFGGLATPIDSRLTALSLALCFPSVSYYLGLLSIEQLVLTLTLPSIVFWNRPLVLVALLMLAASVDIGNASVFAFFLLVTRIAVMLDRMFGTWIVILTLLLGVGTTLALGFTVIQFAATVPALRESVAAILSSMTGNELLAKYPILLRPMITYMNFVFSTPANLKVPLAYLLITVLLVVMTSRVRARMRFLVANNRIAEARAIRSEAVIVLAGLGTVLVLVFALPTYANAKYYIFVMPYLMMLALRVFHPKLILSLGIALSAMVFLQIIMYRAL